MANDPVWINGTAWTFSHYELQIGANRLINVKSINNSVSIEAEAVSGLNHTLAPMGWSEAEYQPGDLTLSVREDTWAVWRDYAAGLSRSGNNYSDVARRYPITFVGVHDDFGTVTHRWTDCVVKTQTFSAENTPTQIYRDVVVMYLRYTENGKGQFRDPE
jgi:hypothetical protein